MKKLLVTPILFIALLLSACTASRETASTEREEKSHEITTVTAETHSVSEATNDWHLRSPYSSAYYGTEVQRAYRELLAEKEPGQEVIVAIIDSGTDIDHEDLDGKIWVNEDEIPQNGLDDDQNGYVDDIHGWNFIGGADSSHVEYDTYEMTRLYAKYRKQFEGMDTDSIPENAREEYNLYQKAKQAYESRVQENNQMLMQVNQFFQAYDMSLNILGISSIDSIDADAIQPSRDDSQQELQAKQFIGLLKNNGATQADIEDTEDYLDYLTNIRDYGLNPDYNPRHIVGDDYEDLNDRYYGNNDVTGVQNEHGTHVAGIVGAVRDNSVGIKGIAENIKLMILRTVPNGDERDKDVANSIRYAAENGARVVNMSFGKGFSPQKDYVDAAIRYADSLGVLLISGSGNDANNIDSTVSYPTKFYSDGGFAKNFISVGASSWQSDSTVAASFSNYGKQNVDLFAPGVDVYSTTPNNTYEMQSGTSMAAPVVTGIAALIMSYYPELSTEQVKEILLTTVTEVDKKVYKPGTAELINFSDLSASGGIVNAYEALKLAEDLSNK